MVAVPSPSQVPGGNFLWSFLWESGRALRSSLTKLYPDPHGGAPGISSSLACPHWAPLVSTTVRALPASLMAQSLKTEQCSAGDLGLIPRPGRSPGEGNGKPLQYPCLENLKDRGAWWGAVHEIAKSWAWLSDQHLHFQSPSTPVLVPAKPLQVATSARPSLSIVGQGCALGLQFSVGPRLFSCCENRSAFQVPCMSDQKRNQNSCSDGFIWAFNSSYCSPWALLVCTIPAAGSGKLTTHQLFFSHIWLLSSLQNIHVGTWVFLSVHTLLWDDSWLGLGILPKRRPWAPCGQNLFLRHLDILLVLSKAAARQQGSLLLTNKKLKTYWYLLN